jgi:hypothetical protein
MREKQTASNISKLMETFGVSGKELADAINVDYSLVSKWKLSKRILSPHSVHTKRIASYFMSLDLQTGYVRIRKLLFNSYPETPMETGKKVEVLLCKWLSHNDDVLASGTFVPGRGVAHAENFYVYDGNGGRRQAIRDLFEYMLKLPEKREINMYSHEEMQWMVEDPDFLDEFKSKMLHLIKRGHYVRIIHTIDRSPDSITSVLNFWIPMHMSGGLQSYYFPKYVDFTERNSIWMVEGEIALVGNSALNDGKDRYSAIVMDAISLYHYNNVFSNYIKECKPLTSVYREPKEMFEIMKDISGIPEPAYLFSQTPLFTSLPSKLLVRILSESGINGENYELCMSHHAKWNQAIDSGQQSFPTRWVHNIEAIQQALSLGPVKYNILSSLAGKEIYLSKKDVSLHIKNIIRLLENHSRIELALTNKQAGLHIPEINFWLKHNYGVFLWPLSQFKNAVSSTEPTLLSGFNAYCENIWHSIPRLNRDKKSVIERLYNLVT